MRFFVLGTLSLVVVVALWVAVGLKAIDEVLTIQRLVENARFGVGKPESALVGRSSDHYGLDEHEQGEAVAEPVESDAYASGDIVSLLKGLAGVAAANATSHGASLLAGAVAVP